MARQYKYLSEGQSLIMTDKTTLIKSRYIVRGAKLCNDRELQAGGFLLAQNVGWEEISAMYGPITGARYRIGKRDYDRIDGEITALGFNGIQDTDWEQLK
jgi:hypothetical protein